MKHITRFVALASFSAVALAASVPFTFTAGTPAKASELNANFTALAAAVTALEAKVAMLEGATPITLASVAGTYRLLSLSSKALGDPVGMGFAVGTNSTNATIVLAPNGSFTFSGVERMSGFSARVFNCSQTTESTSPSGTHSHLYTRTNCTNNAFVNTESPAKSSSSGTGTWRLGAGNTIVINPADGAALVVYLAHGGRTGFSVEADDQVNAGATGQRLQIDVLVRQ